MYHFVLLGHAKEEMYAYAKGESTLGFHSYNKSFSMLQRFYILSQRHGESPFTYPNAYKHTYIHNIHG